MQLIPHLGFLGDCEAAFKFYAGCLNGEVLALVTYGATPMAKEVSAEWQSKIIHGTMRIGDTVIMGADVGAERYEAPKGITLTLGVKDPAEGERLFQALAENGQVVMPYQKTFWSPGFGMVVDKFKVPWMINTEGAPPA